MKIVRLTYNAADATMANPVRPHYRLAGGNDHVSGRLKFGPDSKLYLTIGDRGNNQLGNYCLPIEAQRLPTQQEISARITLPMWANRCVSISMVPFRRTIRGLAEL